MPPLGTLDALDVALPRRRMVAAAAARGWPVRPAQRRSPDHAWREVTHPGGVAIVRGRPRRPHAARSLAELDTLLALGVVPATVGSAPARAGEGWRCVAAEAGIVVVEAGAAAELSAAQVDLVVVSTEVARAHPVEHESYLSLGVPVVQIPAGDVVEQVRIVGEATGSTGPAQRLQAEIRRRFAGFHPASRPASIVVFTCDADGRAHLLPATCPLGALLGDLGLPAPDASVAGPAPGAAPRPLTAQAWPDLDADLLVGLELVAGGLAAVERSPRFAACPAVRAGRYRRFDPATSYAVAVPSALTVLMAIDALTEALR